MTGQRLPDRTDWSSKLPHGSYWKNQYGWWALTPNGDMANLSRHDVIEHEDGTITVAPSIRVSTTGGRELWHGYLERGIWRTC